MDTPACIFVFCILHLHWRAENLKLHMYVYPMGKSPSARLNATLYKTYYRNTQILRILQILRQLQIHKYLALLIMSAGFQTKVGRRVGDGDRTPLPGDKIECGIVAPCSSFILCKTDPWGKERHETRDIYVRWM